MQVVNHYTVAVSENSTAMGESFENPSSGLKSVESSGVSASRYQQAGCQNSLYIVLHIWFVWLKISVLMVAAGDVDHYHDLE